jgi:hypothetical protein
MLQRRSSPLGRWSGASGAILLAGALASLTSTGCASVAGDQDADTKFLIKPKADATFFGWSEITIDQDVNAVEKATLTAVTVEVMDPPSITDLGFLKNVLGETVTSTTRTKVVEKTSMPEGERVVPLDLLYDGDLRGFFEDGHTVRIEWTGATSSTFTAWPADGIWIRVHIIVHIE